MSEMVEGWVRANRTLPIRHAIRKDFELHYQSPVTAEPIPYVEEWYETGWLNGRLAVRRVVGGKVVAQEWRSPPSTVVPGERK